MTALAPPTLASEAVIEALKTAFLGITQANGYATNVASVRRWTRNMEFSFEGPTIILHHGARQILESVGEPRPGYFEAFAEVDVTYVLAVHSQSSESLDIVHSAAAQDLLRAISTVDWPGLEAFVDTVRTQSIYAADSTDPFDGVECEIGFAYRIDPDETWKRGPFFK